MVYLGSMAWSRRVAHTLRGHWKPGVLPGGKKASWSQPVALSLRMCATVLRYRITVPSVVRGNQR